MILFSFLVLLLFISESISKCDLGEKFASKSYKKYCFKTVSKCYCLYVKKHRRKLNVVKCSKLLLKQFTQLKTSVNYQTLVSEPTNQRMTFANDEKTKTESSTSLTVGNSVDNACGLKPGYRQPYVIGGNEARDYQFPWQAAIEVKSGDDFAYRGGGVIISSRWVLTAAHVFQGCSNVSKYRAKFGTIDLNDTNKTVKFDKLVLHPKFDAVSFANDIALLRTQQEIDLHPKTDLTNSICLPKSDQTLVDLLTVSGWGHINKNGDVSDRLKYAVLDLLDNKFCEKSYNSYNKQMMLCAGDLSGFKDSCFGDSGGPAIEYLHVNEAVGFRSFLVGIVSHGKQEGCGIKGVPAVYTRVTNYINWIKRETKLKFEF